MIGGSDLRMEGGRHGCCFAGAALNVHACMGWGRSFHSLLCAYHYESNKQSHENEAKQSVDAARHLVLVPTMTRSRSGSTPTLLPVPMAGDAIDRRTRLQIVGVCMQLHAAPHVPHRLRGFGFPVMSPLLSRLPPASISRGACIGGACMMPLAARSCAAAPAAALERLNAQHARGNAAHTRILPASTGCFYLQTT
jgi:hypothetical protein